MSVTYEKENMKVPVRVWLKERKDSEGSCLEQAYHLSQLPFLHKWVSPMLDIHTGRGMPIGGVIVADGVVIPNAVGVDIGCGMAYTETSIRMADTREVITGNGSLVQAIVGDIMRNVPAGLTHHKTMMPSYTMDCAFEEMDRCEEDAELLRQLEAGYYQIGTLGDGDHFVELQEDDDGYLAVMIHSGSRHFGKSVYDYFYYKARQLNQIWFSSVSDKCRLVFPPVDTRGGKQYLNWIQPSMDFAKENREKMMLAVKAIMEKRIGKYTESPLEFSHDMGCHHNYASFEDHYGKNVRVRKKGTISAQNGELAMIPGAIGFS